MKRSMSFARMAVPLLAAFAMAGAEAALFRSYLSLSGNDANPCTLQQPCRLLPAALAAVNDGGEIWMLDSANYNTAPVLVDKSVKILAIPGEMGSVVANNGDALVVNAPGKDVTLRNLFVLNFANGANGVNIVDAAAVHIEKTTIHDFTSDASSCILYSSGSAARIFVVDSFLRRCRTAVRANVTVNLSPRPSILLDNTRIERGASVTAPTIGVWQTGCVDIGLRNSYVSRNVVAIQVDGLVAGCAPHMTLAQSQIANNTTGISVNNQTAAAQMNFSAHASQITSHTDAVMVVNGAGATSALLDLTFADVVLSQCGNACFSLSNATSDNVNGIRVNLERSHVSNTTTAIDATAPGGSRVRVSVRDSTVVQASGRLIRTAGAGTNGVRVNLIRSNFNHSPFAIEHGYGIVTLDGCNFSNFTNLFVNVGSGDIRSLGNNMATQYDNLAGLTYIVPSVVSPM